MRTLFSGQRNQDLFDYCFTPVAPNLPGGVDTYRFEWATNFDALPTALFTIPRWGYVDPLLTPKEQAGLPPFNNPNQARVVFKGSSHLIPLTSPIWVRTVYILNGVDTTTSAWHLLPVRDGAYRSFHVLAGTVPAAGSLATSLELQLPAQLTGWTVGNLSGSNLKMAFQPGGPEVTVLANTTGYPVSGTSGQVFLRGDGGSVVVSIMAYPPYGL